MKIKRILSTIVAIAMVLGAMTLPVSAAEAALNLADGSLTITSSGYTQGGGAEVAHTDSYTVTAAAGNANAITVSSGVINMTIDGLNINAAGSPAIYIKAGATLNLTVIGENTLQGAAGFAGISVEAAIDEKFAYLPDSSAKLVITEASTGTLNVNGGSGSTSVGGGAGIGGDSCGDTTNPFGGDFGTVIINGGTINANGGNRTSSKYGSGAAIGGGAGLGDTVDDTNWDFCGNIKINGGNITAIGGMCAAGIGEGSHGNYNYSSGKNLNIYITNGEINASGGVNAAGIGASDSGAHGLIEITGGDITATGGFDDSSSAYGGTGIGGGDAGGGTEIRILGTANVVAKGGTGAAAGIGGGNGGYTTKTTIGGAANVTAYGGFPPNRAEARGIRGGAGIGSGNLVNIYDKNQPMSINIDTTGTVVAYGGKGAQAIGFGTRPASEKTNVAVTIGESDGKISAFNYDAAQPAIYGIKADNTIDGAQLVSGDTTAVYWNDTIGSKQAWVKFGSLSDNTSHTYNVSGSTLSLTCGSEEVVTRDFDPAVFGEANNWAVIQQDAPHLLANLYFDDVTTEADRGNGVARFNLVLEGSSFNMVKNFVSGEFTTSLTTISDGPFEYKFEPVNDHVTYYYDTNADGTRKYHVNINEFVESGDNASYTTVPSDKYPNGIIVGVLTVSGYGTGEITIATDGLLLEKHDSTAENLAKDILASVGQSAQFGIVPANCNLTVNITFNNPIKNNVKAYQNMRLTIRSSKLQVPIVIDLGSDAGENVSWDGKMYSIGVELKKNALYSLVLEGAGYRRVSYAVNLTEDKTLNFWNNAKDNGAFIEEGKSSSFVNANFLAGDIVNDSDINLYDLSAVVSYFGANNLAADHPEYVKYDLNRDGVIDSRDVAYVLVSWGN